jgi:hypothetical protein
MRPEEDGEHETEKRDGEAGFRVWQCSDAGKSLGVCDQQVILAAGETRRTAATSCERDLGRSSDAS